MQDILLAYSRHYNRDEMKMESILTMCLFSLSHIMSQLAGNRHIYTSSSHLEVGHFSVSGVSFGCHNWKRCGVLLASRGRGEGGGRDYGGSRVYNEQDSLSPPMSSSTFSRQKHQHYQGGETSIYDDIHCGHHIKYNLF